MRLKSTLAKKIKQKTGRHFKEFIESEFNISPQSFYIRLKKGNVRMAEVAFLIERTGLTFNQLFDKDPEWVTLRKSMKAKVKEGNSVYLDKKKGPGNKKKPQFSFIEI